MRDIEINKRISPQFEILESVEDIILKHMRKNKISHLFALADETKIPFTTLYHNMQKLVTRGLLEDMGKKRIRIKDMTKNVRLYKLK